MRDMTEAFAPGTRLYRVCEVLVQNAPAKAVINGIAIVARHRTSKVDNIYRQYWLNLWKRNPTPENWESYQRAC